MTDNRMALGQACPAEAAGDKDAGRDEVVDLRARLDEAIRQVSYWSDRWREADEEACEVKEERHTLQAERDRLREVLQGMAQVGCELAEVRANEWRTCDEVYPEDLSRWCLACVARAALGD